MTTSDPFQTFKIEAQELVQELEATLLELEERPADQDLVDRAFRALHTLKGSGAMFGPPPLAAFAHHVETAFELIRTKMRPATPELIGHFLKATDELRRLLETGQADPAGEGLVIQALQADLAMPAPGISATPAVTQAEPTIAATGRWRITLRLAEQALLFGTNPMSLLDELRVLGDCQVTACTNALPGLEALDPSLCLTGFEILLSTDRPRQTIEDVFIFVSDEAQLVIEPLPIDGSAEPMLEVTAMPAESARQDDKAVVHREKAAASVRVPAARLDALMDQVGELVIAQARLTQLARGQNDPVHTGSARIGPVQIGPALSAIAEDIERLAGELRDLAMGMRMMPVASLFGRFRRVVRDLSQELGKTVELETAGEDTELDKTVIEALADPLVHLIRNSVDHGIEPADRRRLAGKHAHGRILLSARQAGTEVHIAISDDGGGLDRTRIRDKAERSGLLAAGQSLSDPEIDQLIFHPGFSTAASVSNVSGRDVGMDVVKRTIEALRGVIDVASTPGSGTAITLKLPLTLAIIDGLLVRIGTGIFVIPLAAVHECVELAVTQSRGSDGRSFLDVRGELVPFVRLNQLLGRPADIVPHEMVVIVATRSGRVGLVVDQVIGHHQTVIKTLSPLHRHVSSLGGATIMGDGSVALILDVAALVQLAEGMATEPLCA